MEIPPQFISSLVYFTWVKLICNSLFLDVLTCINLFRSVALFHLRTFYPKSRSKFGSINKESQGGVSDIFMGNRIELIRLNSLDFAIVGNGP